MTAHNHDFTKALKQFSFKGYGQLTVTTNLIHVSEAQLKCFLCVYVCLDGPSNMAVTASPEKAAYISGSDIFLSCSADSKPAASFYWMYNGNNLNVSGSSYNLRNTTSNRSGQYTCVAKNAVTLRSVAVIKQIKIVGENMHTQNMFL